MSQMPVAEAVNYGRPM